VEGVPPSFAALGTGQTEAGDRILVGFSPENGGDAALAALAYAVRCGEEDGSLGRVLAISPQWSTAARRRLFWIGETSFEFAAQAIPGSDGAGQAVPAERPEAVQGVPSDLLAEACTSPGGPALFRRALAALEGLAAKHGGVVRGTDSGAELVLLARRSALLRPESGGVAIDTLLPEKSTARLDAAGLAGAFDRLEGQLRKRLNDKRVKSGEEGLRGEAIGALAAAADLHASCPWPVSGADPDVIDRVGLDASGRPVVALVRERFDLPAAGALLDALPGLQALLPHLFPQGEIRSLIPRVTIAAEQVDPEVTQLFGVLTLDHAFYDLRGRNQVVLRDETDGAVARSVSLAPTDRPQAADPAPERQEGPRRRRGGRGRRRGAGDTRGPVPEEKAASRDEGDATRADETSIDEVSLFDLDDDTPADPQAAEADGGPRRRRRGRRRGRRSSGRDPRPEAASEDPVGETEDTAEVDEDLVAEDAHDPAATLAPLDEGALDVPAPEYEEEEEEPEEDDWMRERDQRQRARAAEVASERAETQDSAPVRMPPRKRSAIVAHADRSSIVGALLLARDIRMLDGFWIYPQEDLMTFFRSVATDLRGDIQIHVVGFHAKPARDTIQAAALYAGRLYWYDHHEWPPEDLESLRSAIGDGYVEVEPGSGSSVPAVLSRRVRRSRFSDKLVELATGRFTQHDYERWGRYWWHRLDQLRQETGEKRREVEPLLAGRPSDLAKVSAAAPLPPLPAEVAYVSERDFRVVHAAGFGLVVVPVPPGIDPHMTGRLARERFGAQVSVTYVEGDNLVLLGADEGRGRQGFELGAMVTHLATKHEWIEPHRDEDHVARLRIRDMAARPERLDEVVGALGMGRSILEG